MQKEQPHWFYIVARWLEDYWLDLAEALWPTVCTLVGLIISDEFLRIVSTSWLGASVFVLALLGGQGFLFSRSLKKRERLSDLRNEINRQEVRYANDVASLRGEIRRLGEKRELRALSVRPLIQSYLKTLSEELDFGKVPHQYERLTLFLHNPERHVFVPLGRYSNSAEFGRIVRTEYPEGEGCIWVVWQRAVYCRESYPDPAIDLESYIRYSAADAYPRERVIATRMRSRVYCGTVIWSNEKQSAVGVLLFEASQNHYSGGTALRERIKKEERGHLGALIDAID